VMKQWKSKQLVKLGVSVLLWGCLLGPSGVPAQVPGKASARHSRLG